MAQENFTKKDTSELTKLLAEKREALRKIRFNIAGSGMRDVREIRTHKKDIARILTELNARKQEVA